MDMPPLLIMVLDALADDVESIETMRNHGQVAPYGLALVEEDAVVEAVRALLRDELIFASQVLDTSHQLSVVERPATDDLSLRRYWFRWTPAGERAWREAEQVLDEYWTAHPPGR